MKRFALIFALGLSLSLSAVRAADAPRVRNVQSFDADWRFLKDDAKEAQAPQFNDAEWRKLDLPHDWSIEGPYDQAAPTRGSGGSLPAGIGWYRKSFTLPADASSKRVFIEFDGVMANSDVWINGFNLGHRPYGYSSFQYDMTGHLNFGEGKANVIAVRADNSQQPASRWYAGAGIYRHVRLVIADPVHVDHWGTYVTTPQVANDSATVHVQSTVINQSDAAKEVTIQTTILAPDGQTVQTAESAPQSVPAGKSVEFNQDIKVTNPKLWNVAGGQMYRAVTAVRSGGKSIDDDVASFGIRNFEFRSDTGFWLNGKNMKLLGVCLHSDGGAFGMAVPMGVWERRLNNLRELGVNAIRCAHNPPDPAFLDLLDRMGFLVMDETFDCWLVSKNPADYHLYFKEWNLIDTRDLVMRDRNHPSIVLYSTGNEIHDTPNFEVAKALLKPMVDEIHKWDPTRPVTQALFRPNSDRGGGAYNNGLADMLDVIGTNYRDAELLRAWAEKPGRKIVGTEQQMGLDTWLNLRDNPQHSGQFLWVGIDYLGEAQWPQTGSAQGLLDRLGQIKPLGYERQAWWGTKPMVKIVRAEGAAQTTFARGQAPTPDGGFGDAGADRPRGATSGPGARGARGRGAVPDGGLGNAGADQARGPTTGPGARGARGARAGGGAGARGGARGPTGPVANWTLREGATPGSANVTVYSNCEEVELFVNDKSMGSKPKHADDSHRIWNLAYEPGTIRAVGKNKGQIVATDELKTAGSPVKIVLTADQQTVTPTFDDVVFVNARIVDANGIEQPNAENRIHFAVSGPGRIAVVDNADRMDHDPYQASDRTAEQGRATAVIKATGPSGQITITATADGLQGSSVSVSAAAPK
jgi:beta-galactosidase